MQTVEVCKDDELANGTFVQAELAGFPILVGRSAGRLFAIGSRCAHYGLTMQEGTLSDCRLRCPYHGARFNVHSGDIEEAPGLDCLPTFVASVRQSDGIIVVEGRAPADYRRRLPAVGRASTSTTTIVVAGGGVSACSAVETLRQEGFDGRVVAVSADSRLPYDRAKVSKDLANEAAALREPEFYEELGVEFLLDSTIREVDPERRLLLADTPDGRLELKYSKLIVCTGLEPKMLSTPVKLPASGISHLHSAADAARVARAAAGADVAVVGSSFVAMEAASSLIASGIAKSVTLVTRSTPLSSKFGEEVGARLRRLCESRGLRFVVSEVAGFESDSAGRLTGVSLADGGFVPAGVCLVAVGSRPCADAFLPRRLLDADGFVDVDDDCRCRVDANIFAAGDAVARVGGHWHAAQVSGRLAARACLGQSVADKWPKCQFYWTSLFGRRVQFVGILDESRRSWQRVQFVGNDEKYIAYLVDANECAVACVSFGMTTEPSRLADLLSDKGEPVPMSDVIV